MAYTLSDARQWIRQFARNAGDSSIYSDSDVDRALAICCDDFIWYTRFLRASFTLATVATTETIDGATAPTGFLPSRILRCWIEDEGPLDVVDQLTILEKRVASDSTGVPKWISFTSNAQVDDPEVYPTPDAVYTVKIMYVPPFTSWTIGTTSPGSTTFNLPDDILRQIFAYGAPATLQHAEPEHGFTGPSYQKYLQFRELVKSTGGLGARSTSRAMAEF